MSARMGDPLPRPDGLAKVTGRAKYAADQFLPHRLYAALVGAAIPAGRVLAIDATAALAVPGVVRVLTHDDMPRFTPAPVPPLASSFIPMQTDEIRHEGQPLAIVLADTLEAAEHATHLVKIQYESASFTTWDDATTQSASKDSGYASFFESLDFRKGDTSAGLAAATYRHDATYSQPSRHHNAMEPHASIAHWEDDRLTIYDSVQHGYGTRFILANMFDVPPDRVRVICPHTGGGFGAKGYIWPHEFLAAAAAKIAQRPVKLVLTRAQVYTNVGYQPQMTQTMTLGVDATATFTALRHEVVNLTSVSDDFVEWATEASKGLYATPTMHLRQRVRRANVNLPTALRAPVEGPGTFALESAMDELAYTIHMDPLDLRLTNYALVDPADGRPWSSKKLLEAYEQGARLFRWRERPSQPQRDGHWLIGYGMASCTMGAFRFPSKARVQLRADGSAEIAAGFHDIGTGTITIFTQIASEVLGIDPSNITVANGDTMLPEAGPTYGSSSTAGVGAAVLDASQRIHHQLAAMARLSPEALTLRDGRLICPDSAIDGTAITDLMRRAGVGELTGDGVFTLPNDAPYEGGGLGTPYSMRTFGAVFVEVGVDPELGLLRLRRAVGSYSAGRIINPRTARAQMSGGMIWGWGMAAMEASRHEPTLGRWLSKNLSGVAIPVNADIPGDITIHFVDEVDPHAGPLGAKGIGELGATGVAAAVANAVFDATGKRVRSLPITPDKLV